MCAAVASAGAQDSTLAPGPRLSSARAVLACARRVVDAAGFRVEPLVEPRKVGFRAFKLGSGTTSYQEVDLLGVVVTEEHDTVPPHLEIFAETDVARAGSRRRFDVQRPPTSFALIRVEDTIRAECSPGIQ